eukprot:2724306-Pyramimonas_sp.AAC.1
MRGRSPGGWGRYVALTHSLFSFLFKLQRSPMSAEKMAASHTASRTNSRPGSGRATPTRRPMSAMPATRVQVDDLPTSYPQYPQVRAPRLKSASSSVQG